jgi:hypothetical protein
VLLTRPLWASAIAVFTTSLSRALLDASVAHIMAASTVEEQKVKSNKVCLDERMYFYKEICGSGIEVNFASHR